MRCSESNVAVPSRKDCVNYERQELRPNNSYLYRCPELMVHVGLELSIIESQG